MRVNCCLEQKVLGSIIGQVLEVNWLIMLLIV